MLLHNRSPQQFRWGYLTVLLPLSIRRNGRSPGDVSLITMIGILFAILLITLGLRWKYVQHKDAVALTRRWRYKDLPNHEADESKRK
jgi:hypothetical protein